MVRKVVADALPPMETVKTSVAGVRRLSRQRPLGGERRLQIKKSPSFDLSDSSELLPSFGLSSSPTLPWGRSPHYHYLYMHGHQKNINDGPDHSDCFAPPPPSEARNAPSGDHMGCAPGYGREGQDDRIRNTGLSVQILGVR